MQQIACCTAKTVHRLEEYSRHEKISACFNCLMGGGMDGWRGGGMNGWRDGWVEAWMGGGMDGWKHEWGGIVGWV